MAMAMSGSGNKLKIKIVTKKPDSDTGALPPSRDVGGISAYGSGRSGSNFLKKCGNQDIYLRDPVAPGDGIQSQSILGVKRGSDEMLDPRNRKKLKMDRSVNRKCSMVLKKLVAHPESYPFLSPVDPVALRIPDYFTIISEPMDLGTIRSKLEGNVYAAAEEFEADVRLTFSNAMEYNPPDNHVHRVAKVLNSLFSSQWRNVMLSLDKQDICDTEKKINSANINRSVIAPARSDALSGSSASRAGRKDTVGSKEVAVARESSKVVTKQNAKIGKAFKLSSSHPDAPGAKSSANARGASAHSTCNVKNASVNKRSNQSVGATKPEQTKIPPIGRKAPLINARAQEVKSLPVKNMPPTNTRAQEAKPLPVKKTPQTGNRSAEKTVDEVAKNSDPQICKYDHDSDGATSCVDEEHASAAVTFPTASASDVWIPPTCDIQLSPGRAMRAAMLKKRFAHTILKAQQQSTLRPSDRLDSIRMDEEQRRLERKQHEEKQKFEAQIKAAKQRIEKQREAARKSLEKMESTVLFEDNITILTDLAHMIGDFSFAGPLRGLGGNYVASNQFVNGKLKSPLERLGLFLKEDEEDAEETAAAAAMEGCEEGEIIVG